MQPKVLRLLFLWTPVLVQMSLIFYFSSQPSGSPTLEKFPFSSVIGHFGGYFLLGFLLYRALAGGLNRWDGQAARLAVLLAILYGVTDELHQAFVPGRNPSPLDVVIDGAGALSAILVCRAWLHLRRHYKQRIYVSDDGH